MDGPLSSGASRIGLVRGGGGAIAAYQAGVLRAIAHLLPRDASNPFPVISGTSAGAINAVALASNAANFRAGVRRMVLIWRNLHVHQVYRSDFPGVAKSGARWLKAMMFGLGGNHPISLLDNSPLRSLLTEHVDFGTWNQGRFWGLRGESLRAGQNCPETGLGGPRMRPSSGRTGLFSL